MDESSGVAHGLGWHNFHGSWPTLDDVPVTYGIRENDPWAHTIGRHWWDNFKSVAAPICDDTGRLILPLLASRFEGSLTVLDFGGGPGAGLADLFKFTRLDASRLSYILVETPAMCTAVRREIEVRGGKVYEHIPEALPKPLIVNASSSLQYISNYKGVLWQFARLAPEIIILSQTPTTDCPTYACQILNAPYRKIAVWVFNRAELIAEMQEIGFALTFVVDHDLPLTHNGAPGSLVIASMIFSPLSPTSQ